MENIKDIIQKVNEYKWIIPKRNGMNVPGIIYISEELIGKAISDNAPLQIMNVAKLPGIVKYSLAMPDVHWGYGAPIGGVGAFDMEKGVIVPGFVGYDINCLAKNTKILTDYGYYLNVEDFENLWRKVITYDTEKKESKKRDVLRFIKQKKYDFIYSIKTETGYEIKVTEEHPLFTLKGKKRAKDLEIGDNLIIYPFEGIQFSPPSDEIIIDEVEFKKILKKFKKGKRGNAEEQIINILKGKNLLPLKFSSPSLPKILKIIGYLFGRGSLSLEKTGRFILFFYGKHRALKELQKDIESIGFKGSIYLLKRKESKYFAYKTSSTTLSLLLIALGAPYGEKTDTKFTLPNWILKGNLWQKRLFLASFFGVRMPLPQLNAKETKFYQITLQLTKNIKYTENGIKFFKQIEELCNEFGVKIKNISLSQAIKENRKIIKMIIPSTIENLQSLWWKIGFEYNQEKQHFANLSLFYLKKKQQVEKTSFDRFFEFKEKIEEKLGKSGFIYDTIKEIKKLPYSDYVYDLTILDKNHNFVANNFLVSNCGVRLLRTNLQKKDIENKIEDLINALFRNVPSGVGSTGKIKLKRKELEKVIVEGALWAIKNGFGDKNELEKIEEKGCLEGADPSAVSNRAYERGMDQLETLGSGNHFLEVQHVIEIYDKEIAEAFGLFPGQITVMVHTGSRGFGYQICDDYLSSFGKVVANYGISIPDRQLVCAPINSPEGKKYFSAMKAAANYAFANRQIISHLIKETFYQVLKISPSELGMDIVYDIAHNIGKTEKHIVEGKEKLLYIHRKGATRAFPKGNSEVPEIYRNVGQPVIIPGTMGTASYVLVGTEKAMEETWGSTCHGAGRMMSRHEAIRESRGTSISEELAKEGILARATSKKGLAEEMPKAYKNVDKVIEAVEGAGISKKVAKMVPLAVMKG